MDSSDLDYFVVGCQRKEEQLQFINSQRTNAAQRSYATLATVFSPWRVITDQNRVEQNVQVATKRHEWLLNQLLYELSRCP